MTVCINLKERFGNRYRISLNPAYNSRGRPKKSLDPWMMVIPCRYGEIYPNGGTELVVEVLARSRLKDRLARLPASRVHQDADDICSFVFDVIHFEVVAKIVQPCKRRIASDRQREAARQSMLILNRKTTVPLRTNRHSSQA